jgi:hypothetical protein
MIRFVVTILFFVAVIFATQFLMRSVAAAPIFADGHKPGDKETVSQETEDQAVDLSKLTPYKRVGVIAFEELRRSVTGEKRFLPILLGRLANACPDTDFVEIEVKLDEETPLMGEMARRIGEENGLDAILTGNFAITIQGGVYPSKTNNIPLGKIDIECRVIECESGWSRGKVLMMWEKNHLYPQTIRTQKDLEGRMMRDGVDDLIKMLMNKGLLHFEAEDAPAGDGEENGGGDSDAGSEAEGGTSG